MYDLENGGSKESGKQEYSFGFSFKLVILTKRNKMRRDKAIEMIKELPNEFELEALIERLIFIDKVEKGLKQAEEGKNISHEDVKKKISEWPK